MSIEALMREIRALPVDERKQLIVLIVDTFTETPSSAEKRHSILEFEGVGAHLRDDRIDAQEYVNQLRKEWDHRP